MLPAPITTLSICGLDLGTLSNCILLLISSFFILYNPYGYSVSAFNFNFVS